MAAETAYSLESLDHLLEQAMLALRGSQEQMFQLAEEARREYQRLMQELEQVKKEALLHIERVDLLDLELRRSRERLAVVSRNFHRYSEDDIKTAYERAEHLQVELSVEREREKTLRERRDELDRSLRNIKSMVDRAEQMMKYVNMALELLMGNLDQMLREVGGLREKAEVAARIIQAQEAERVRIAREIHDGPAQSMANIVLRAEICQTLYERGEAEKVMSELRDLREAVKEALQEVRRIIFNLRPMTLDDLGLGPTLRRYVEEFNARGSPPVELVILGKESRLPQMVEVSAFRLVQEALNNARNHARATQLQAKIEFTEHHLIVQVKDNGRGFDLEEARKRGREEGHFGLMSMGERVDLLSGSLDIKSAIGQGTQITARFPLDTAEEIRR